MHWTRCYTLGWLCTILQAVLGCVRSSNVAADLLGCWVVAFQVVEMVYGETLMNWRALQSLESCLVGSLNLFIAS